ncbi:hypothetical protein QP162_03995 [Sphingomonas aurantiaca]|uniref:hypothetical protein n=1 Tax=Sphingomonas aurantiaca TaxID=185949 RepID=UPI002FE3C180
MPRALPPSTRSTRSRAAFLDRPTDLHPATRGRRRVRQGGPLHRRARRLQQGRESGGGGGDVRVKGYALFRIAGLYTSIAPLVPAYRQTAFDSLRRIDETTEPDLAPFRDAAKFLRCRLQGTGVNAGRDCIAATNTDRVSKAELIYAPPIDLNNWRQENPSTVARLHGEATPQWADVAFRVAPDGTVRDIDTVRTSTNVDAGWMKLVTDALGERRYRPLQRAPSDEGLRRIERYSIVYDVVSMKGTRIRARSSVPHIEILDLTVEPGMS